jgi:hypothetical protein
MPRPKLYTVTLTDAQRQQLTSITQNYRYSQRERNRAQILLQTAQGQTDPDIAQAVGCSTMTVRNVRLRFCQQEAAQTRSIKQAVKRAVQKKRAKRALDGRQEAHLIALACSAPPEGANRWTLQLLHDRLIEMSVVERIGKETIRRTLKKTNLSPG